MNMHREDYECAEPYLQAKMEAVLSAGGNPRAANDLLLHLEICHACREQLAFAMAVQSAVAAGAGVSWTDKLRHRLGLAPGALRQLPGEPSRAGIWALAGSLAAAALLLTVVLPPTQQAFLGFSGTDLRPRSGDAGIDIRRPVEGEVLFLKGGELEWQAVDKAQAYRITVDSPDGSFHWSGLVKTNAIDLPEGKVSRGSYIATVEPLPTDLVPEGEGSVFFSRDGLWTVLGYRLTHMPIVSALLVLGAASLAVVGLIRRH